MIRIFGGKYQLKNEKGDWEDIERAKYKELLENDTQSAFDVDEEEEPKEPKETPEMAHLTAKNGNKVIIKGVSYDDKGLKFDFSMNDKDCSMNGEEFYNMLMGEKQDGITD